LVEYCRTTESTSEVTLQTGLMKLRHGIQPKSTVVVMPGWLNELGR